MSLPQGTNHRSTAGYVTDLGNDYQELTSGGNQNYPVTSAQGNNIGWETTSSTYQARNRNASNNAKIAGLISENSAVTRDYRIDLPTTGTKNIRVAMGDASYSRAGQKMEVFDTTTSLGVLFSGVSTGAANSFVDATGSVYTAANWPGSNTSVSKTFTTTIARFRAGDGASIFYVNHIYIEDAAGGAVAKVGAMRRSYPRVARR